MIDKMFAFNFADHYGVQDREQLQSLHDKHYAALVDLLERTHDSPDYIQKVSIYLPYLKSLSYQHMKALNDFKSTGTAEFEFTALHRELFASALV